MDVNSGLDHLNMSDCILKSDENPYKKRKLLAQALAATANSLLLLSIGAAFGFPTVEVAGITNGDDYIKASQNELSWLGSLFLICQPIGSLMSGSVAQSIGRKRATMLVNVPHIIAWIMISCTKDLTTLLIANVFLGIGNGLMEAPILTYCGEICEPSVRGIALSYGITFSNAGIFVIYLLGTVLPWRIASAICISIPLLTIMSISLVPESPIWLLSQGRNDDALKALCWLRGWVEPSMVKEEFDYLIQYNRRSIRCKFCPTVDANGHVATSFEECPHQSKTRWQLLTYTIKGLTARETLRPMVLSTVVFVLNNFTGMSSIRPSMVNMFNAFNTPLDAQWATVSVGVLGIMASVLCALLVSWTGKRLIILTSTVVSAMCTLGLGVYAYYNVPHNVSTYEEVQMHGATSIIPAVILLLMSFINSFGIVTPAWMIPSEIFPFKTRAIASGIVAATNYLSGFVASKTYIYLEKSAHIYGAFYVYTVITLIGLLFLYLYFPETENRTHQEIENDFSNENLKIYANDCFAEKVKIIFGAGISKNESANKDVAMTHKPNGSPGHFNENSFENTNFVMD